ERAERRRASAGPRERAVEDVEHRADDEDAGAEPVEEDRVPRLERNEDGGDDAERDAGRRQRVRRDTGLREARDGPGRELPCSRRIAGLDAAAEPRRGG